MIISEVENSGYLANHAILLYPSLNIKQSYCEFHIPLPEQRFFNRTTVKTILRWYFSLYCLR
jgi:hypothetical protein